MAKVIHHYPVMPHPLIDPKVVPMGTRFLSVETREGHLVVYVEKPEPAVDGLNAIMEVFSVKTGETLDIPDGCEFIGTVKYCVTPEDLKDILPSTVSNALEPQEFFFHVYGRFIDAVSAAEDPLSKVQASGNA